MEAIPRISRAQSMDALSSQSNVAGYKAALLGADEMGRFYPMLMTAAGTIPPAKVLVLGVGVAGLQALATAKRLGARTTGYDVRPEVAEQVQSLGAQWLDLGLEASGEGGYARELTEEERARQQQALTDAIKGFDVVITTALVPGRPAPKLVTAEAVEGMKPGSVIVDLAGEAGGNCELTEPGQTVVRHDVKIVSPLNLPAGMAEHASQLFARNVLALLELFVGEDGALQLNFDDEIVSGACIVRDGEIVHAGARAAAAAGIVILASVLTTNLAILVLAGFIGFVVISKVPNTLHTPLMSGTNAIHGIVLLGGLLRDRPGRQRHLQQGHPRDRHRLRHDQRGRRLPRDRPHARDVQVEAQGSGQRDGGQGARGRSRQGQGRGAVIARHHRSCRARASATSSTSSPSRCSSRACAGSPARPPPCAATASRRSAWRSP